MMRSDMLKRQATVEKKQAYREQFRNLTEAEAALQQNWDDDAARQALNLAQQTLHQMRMEKQDKWKTELDIKWNTVGDTCSR